MQSETKKVPVEVRYADIGACPACNCKLQLVHLKYGDGTVEHKVEAKY